MRRPRSDSPKRISFCKSWVCVGLFWAFLWHSKKYNNNTNNMFWFFLRSTHRMFRVYFFKKPFRTQPCPRQSQGKTGGGGYTGGGGVRNAGGNPQVVHFQNSNDFKQVKYALCINSPPSRTAFFSREIRGGGISAGFRASRQATHIALCVLKSMCTVPHISKAFLLFGNNKHVLPVF